MLPWLQRAEGQYNPGLLTYEPTELEYPHFSYKGTNKLFVVLAPSVETVDLNRSYLAQWTQNGYQKDIHLWTSQCSEDFEWQHLPLLITFKTH